MWSRRVNGALDCIAYRLGDSAVVIDVTIVVDIPGELSAAHMCERSVSSMYLLYLHGSLGWQESLSLRSPSAPYFKLTRSSLQRECQ